MKTGTNYWNFKFHQLQKNYWAYFKPFAIAYIILSLLMFFLFNGINGRRLIWNTTASLPGIIYMIDTNDKDLNIGNVYAIEIPKNNFSSNRQFLKILWASAGDNVTFTGQDFYINGVFRGRAKQYSKQGVKLEHSSGGVIRPGYYFFGTPHKDSFDSRYETIGNIPEHAVIGHAKRII